MKKQRVNGLVSNRVNSKTSAAASHFTEAPGGQAEQIRKSCLLQEISRRLHRWFEGARTPISALANLQKSHALGANRISHLTV